MQEPSPIQQMVADSMSRRDAKISPLPSTSIYWPIYNPLYSKDCFFSIAVLEWVVELTRLFHMLYPNIHLMNMQLVLEWFLCRYSNKT